MTPLCKHPIVKIVAREDDVEFVECQSCGEVFDSAEFEDMAREEKLGAEDAEELLLRPQPTARRRERRA